MSNSEKFLEKSMNRREFGTGLLMGGLALSMPLHLLPVSHAHANPLMFLLRLLPFFGRSTLMRAAGRGLIRNAARATSRQAIRRGTAAAGGMSFMGTATTAWAAYDVVSLLSMSSDAVQSSVQEYGHYPQATEKPISMIWDADDVNEILIQGVNYSGRPLLDSSLNLVLYDIKAEKDIARLPVPWSINLEPNGTINQIVQVPPLPLFVDAGALITVDFFLENTDPEDVVLQPSDVIVIERKA